MRIFLDTNVLASALATRGLCAELLEAVLTDHELVISPGMLEELRRVLAEKFRLPARVIKGFVALLQTEGRLSVDQEDLPVEIPDRDDAPLLASALAARVDVFVTGDHALLALGKVKGLPILSPRQLWEKLHRRG